MIPCHLLFLNIVSKFGFRVSSFWPDQIDHAQLPAHLLLVEDQHANVKKTLDRINKISWIQNPSNPVNPVQNYADSDFELLVGSIVARELFEQLFLQILPR